MARNLTTGLQRGLRRSLRPGLGGGDLFTIASLDLNLARYKTLDPRITFTRASSGTYVGADGLIKTATTNEARFDHNPTTGESLGLLVEESRTNLLVRSEEFDNASWTKLNATITSNTDVSPAGTLASDLVASTGGETRIGVSGAVSASTTYTASIYGKYANTNGRYLWFRDFYSGKDVSFDLLNGTAVTVATGTTASVVKAANGYYKCAVTWTTPASVVVANQQYFVQSASGTNVSSGASGGQCYLWGAQLEEGSFPTSYIPTTTAAVTRSADVASISGSNFSSWYRQDEGTVFVDFNGTNIASGQFPRILELNDGTSSNLIRVQQYGTNLVRTSVTTANVTQFAADNGSVAAGIRGKTAFGSALNDAALVTNGASPTVDTAYLVPNGLTQLGIGSPPGASASVFNSTIRRLTYWPQRLPNATLRQITQ